MRITADRFEGVVDGFAAGALLVMLVSAMVPEAQSKVQDRAGPARGYSVEMARRTLRREARRAGNTAASTPTTAAMRT